MSSILVFSQQIPYDFPNLSKIFCKYMAGGPKINNDIPTFNDKLVIKRDLIENASLNNNKTKSEFDFLEVTYLF